MSMPRPRSCGILLHPTSLPGSGGIGTLGKPARDFVDFLKGGAQSYWQMLPLGPPAKENSPMKDSPLLPAIRCSSIFDCWWKRAFSGRWI